MSVPEVAASIYALLEPLEDGDRQRAVAGAMAMLGTGVPAATVAGPRAPAPGAGAPGTVTASSAFGAKAQRWISKCGITQDVLEETFHVVEDGTVEVLAGSVPGSTQKDQSVNAYLLLGAANLLATDSPTCSDDEAVELCKRVGCYDNTNHNKYRKEVQKLASGSKAAGWTISAKGLKAIGETLNPGGSH